METDRKKIFKERFQEHYSRLCSIAYSYVAILEDSEDIVQELFVSLWNNEKDLLPEKEFATYATTAVKNRCISYLRQKKNLVCSIEDFPNAASSAPADDDDENVIHTRKKLNEALKTLPPKCRSVFLLSKAKGLKYREIAEKMEISEKTVENQMTKAIKMLRTYLASEKHVLATIIVIVISIIVNNL